MSSGKRRLPLEEYVSKYKERFNREPRNANELIQFSKKLRNALPIPYGEARKYFQKGRRAAGRATEEKEQKEPAPAYQEADDVVLTKERTGTVRFVGKTKFGPGVWYGIELHDQFVGKCDGTREGKRYFVCGPNRGMFVQERKIRRKMTRKDHERKASWMAASAERKSRAGASGFSSDAETVSTVAEPVASLDEKETETEEPSTDLPEAEAQQAQEAEPIQPEPSVEPELEPEPEPEPAGDAEAVEEPPPQIEEAASPVAQSEATEEKEIVVQVDDLDFYAAKAGENLLQFCANQADLHLRSDLLDLYADPGVTGNLRIVFEDLKAFDKRMQHDLLLQDLLPRLKTLIRPASDS